MLFIFVYFYYFCFVYSTVWVYITLCSLLLLMQLHFLSCFVHLDVLNYAMEQLLNTFSTFRRCLAKTYTSTNRLSFSLLYTHFPELVLVWFIANQYGDCVWTLIIFKQIEPSINPIKRLFFCYIIDKNSAVCISDVVWY